MFNTEIAFESVVNETFVMLLILSAEDESVDVDADERTPKGFSLVFDNVNQRTEARYMHNLRTEI